MALIQEISSALVALHNCEKAGNPYAATWHERLDDLESKLPHGSGLDGDVKIDRDGFRASREVTITLDYHHMNEHGCYVGWSRHVMWVRPVFAGIEIEIAQDSFESGIEIEEDEREALHNYLAETFDYALTR